MDRCGEPYVQSLRDCVIRPGSNDNPCKWVSSVYEPAGDASTEELSATYWRDNMVQAALFTDAVGRMLNGQGLFDAALEIGPHPALKGPITQTMKAVNGIIIPYSGTLNRGSNDIVAFRDSLAFLWTHSSSVSIKVESYAATFASGNSSAAEEGKRPPFLPIRSFSITFPGLSFGKAVPE